MELSVAHSFAVAALVVLLYMLMVYGVALVRRDSEIVHVAWGPGFVLVAFAVLWWQDSVTLRQAIATTAVTVWGVWFGVHMFLRDWGGTRHFPHHFFKAFFRVFMAQGLLTLVALAPVVYINTYAGYPLNWLDGVGAIVWLGGFAWEMARKHRFGQAIQAWGLWIVALSVPGGWMTVFGPLAVTALAYRFTHHYAQRKNESTPIYT